MLTGDPCDRQAKRAVQAQISTRNQPPAADHPTNRSDTLPRSPLVRYSDMVSGSHGRATSRAWHHLNVRQNDPPRWVFGGKQWGLYPGRVGWYTFGTVRTPFQG